MSSNEFKKNKKKLGEIRYKASYEKPKSSSRDLGTNYDFDNRSNDNTYFKNLINEMINSAMIW